MISKHSQESLEDSIKECDLHKLFQAVQLSEKHRATMGRYYDAGSAEETY